MCPVCGWNNLELDPNTSSHEICDCCNTQFGLDDIPESESVCVRSIDSNGVVFEENNIKNISNYSTREGMLYWLRNFWVSHGMKWSYGKPPENWDPKKQLSRIVNDKENG